MQSASSLHNTPETSPHRATSIGPTLPRSAGQFSDAALCSCGIRRLPPADNRHVRPSKSTPSMPATLSTSATLLSAALASAAGCPERVAPPQKAQRYMPMVTCRIFTALSSTRARGLIELVFYCLKYCASPMFWSLMALATKPASISAPGKLVCVASLPFAWYAVSAWALVIPEAL